MIIILKKKLFLDFGKDILRKKTGPPHYLELPLSEISPHF
jgi:hypothetical protein